MTTSNNLGVNAGTANTLNYRGGGDYSSAVTFTPSPHTVSFQNPNLPSLDPPATETSPGYMQTIRNSSTMTTNDFYGMIAGINDHGNLAVNEFTWSRTATVVTPHLITGTDVSLGSLGGVGAAVYALNNSNQLVGWSQIASGAQHAFLYSNGTMQDLNLLIPPLSGITLSSAVGIDSAGEIVAFGTDASGQSNEYLLTPVASVVPEPSTLAVFTVMIATFVITKAARCSSAKR